MNFGGDICLTTLLHTFTCRIYGAFDEIARKRHIFKVETVGDCYVRDAVSFYVCLIATSVDSLFVL